MPYPHFGKMAEDDVHAVMAYIRSLKAIENHACPDAELNFPMNLIVRTIPRPAASSRGRRPSDKVAYGAYIDAVGALRATVTRRSTIAVNRCRARFRRRAGVRSTTGYRVRAANITPDADTGIGSWTEQQFVDKFKGFENTPAVDPERGGAAAEHGDADGPPTPA